MQAAAEQLADSIVSATAVTHNPASTQQQRAEAVAFFEQVGGAPPRRGLDARGTPARSNPCPLAAAGESLPPCAAPRPTPPPPSRAPPTPPPTPPPRPPAPNRS
jgi:hypothetical protein